MLIRKTRSNIFSDLWKGSHGEVVLTRMSRERETSGDMGVETAAFMLHNEREGVLGREGEVWSGIYLHAS